MSKPIPECLAHDGTPIVPGQIWLSKQGDMESLMVGFGSEGFPVFEKLDGWPCQGEYFDVEKYWKSIFLHRLKPDNEGG